MSKRLGSDEWWREEGRIALKDYRHSCRLIQERLTCHNCGKIFGCRCTFEENFMAMQRTRNRRMAEWHQRLALIDEVTKCPLQK